MVAIIFFNDACSSAFRRQKRSLTYFHTNRQKETRFNNSKAKNSDGKWVILPSKDHLMHKLTEKTQERLFLCKKMGESGDYSIFCRIFATDFLLRNAYEAIRRISALRREHREGQGL